MDDKLAGLVRIAGQADKPPDLAALVTGFEDLADRLDEGDEPFDWSTVISILENAPGIEAGRIDAETIDYVVSEIADEPE